MYFNEHEKIASICYGNILKPKTHIALPSYSIISGSGFGTYINKTVKLKMTGCGICKCEFKIVDIGNTDCTLGTRFTNETEIVLLRYDIDGYDTCTCCNGLGVIKHDFRSFDVKE